jgi:hypothetical protein
LADKGEGVLGHERGESLFTSNMLRFDHAALGVGKRPASSSGLTKSFLFCSIASLSSDVKGTRNFDRNLW